MVEQRTENPCVPSSILGATTIYMNEYCHKSIIEDLVKLKYMRLLCAKKHIINNTKKTINDNKKILADLLTFKTQTIVLLHGAKVFYELIKNYHKLPNPQEIKLSSYVGLGSIGKLTGLEKIKINPKTEKIIIVEDLIDSGNTIKIAVKAINKISNNKIKKSDILILTLFNKPKAIRDKEFFKELNIINIFEISNEFIVGFGLDYNNHFRDISSVYQIIKIDKFIKYMQKFQKQNLGK